MSQISVVHYNPSLNKINVLQQNNVGNKPNERQVIVLRKSPHQARPTGDVILSPSPKKKTKTEKESKAQPIAVRISVARRNARERNRVKQVNNGFANLRQHIPNFIAAAFENNSGRGGSKKLSKVETLRMAVEYIRSLENILSLSSDGEHPSEVSSYPSPVSSTSPNDPNQLTYTYQVLSPPTEEDELVPTTPQQFIKIDPATNSYLIPTTVYENGENLDPMDQHLLADPSLLDSNLEFSVDSQDLSYLHAINSTSSLSPGFYSEEASMSPMSDVKGDQHAYVTVYHTPPGEPGSPGVVSIKNEEVDMPVISLKTEADLPEEHQGELEDVLEWWERQPQDMGS